uniref:Uncharacterized protein n=1 Tax=viral metagenome TaxID=1070528 RepID=A0A6M3IFH2_9ZZZZ
MDNTLETRVSRLEAAIERLGRRAHKTVMGIVPPTLVYTFAQRPMEDGTILTAALFNGKITKGLMVVKEYISSAKLEFTLRVIRSDGDYSMKFKSSKLWEEIDLEIDVALGDVMEFSVDDPGGLLGIWISFLYEPAMEHKKVINQMRDQLELLDEGI